jgi:FAD/FMN-containing dehydrogenase
VIILARSGGAVAEVSEDATPIGGRSAHWFYHCDGIWTDAHDTRHISWVKDTGGELRPWTTAGMALNFFTDVDDDRVRSAFGEEKYCRLVALKDRYDPDNVFRRNQNVPPSTAAT